MKPTRLVVATMVALAPHALGQGIPTREIHVGDPIPGGGGVHVTAIHAIDVNDVGGYAAHVETSAINHDDLAWGTSDGGPRHVLRQSGVVMGQDQRNWGAFGVGFSNDGEVAYRGAVGAGYSESVWKEDGMFVYEGTPSTVPGLLWDRIGLVRMTSGSGAPFFLADLKGVAGARERSGLFIGTSAQPLLVGYQAVPGIPGPLDADPVPFNNFDVSAHAGHWAAIPRFEGGLFGLVVDGTLHSIQGHPVMMGESIPASLGSGSWGYLTRPQVTEQGDIAFLHSKMGVDTLILNGVVVYRNGDILGSHAIDDIRSFDMNEAGEIVMVARRADGSEILVIEDRVAAHTGQAVDLDGDGVPEAHATIRKLDQDSIIHRPQITEHRQVFFLAWIDIMGTPEDPTDDIEGVYRVRDAGQGPGSYCASKVSSHGCQADLRFFGNPSATAPGIFSISAARVPRNSVGVLAYSTQGKVRVPFQGGTLCIAPPLRRMPPRSSSGIGGVECSHYLAQPFLDQIQSGVDPTLTPGTRVHAQWFYRDPADPYGWGMTNAGWFVVQP